MRFLLLVFLCSPLVAEEPSASEQADRKARFAFIHERMNAFALQLKEQPDRKLGLTEAPILKYTDPVRSADGIAATYLWLDGPLPAAAGSLSIRQEGKVYRELVNLRPGPLMLTRAGAAIWTPESGPTRTRLADAAVPAASPVQRLTQMRALARQFSITNLREPPVELRLLPQPIYRYAAPDRGVIDGALFSFVEATDPETLLILEALGEKAEPAWHYAFARMTSPGIEARLGGKVVWTAQHYWKNPRAKTDPYQEAFQETYSALDEK